MAELAEDSIVAGKYRLLRKLGQGGMGSVWLAEHLTLRSQVAIKVINLDMIQNPEILGRFLREAQAAASLRSPHVVQILDHGVDDGTPYIAMELLEGESLSDRLARVGRIAPQETARIMTHVARAIGRAHEAGIVHRDLKPDNVFLVSNDDEEIAKVLDFGIAKTTAPGSLGAAASNSTRTGAVLGTPYYMSPEQAEGARTLDHRSDIWAMGVITFECLLGRRPFDAETLGGLLLAICTREIAIPSQSGPVPAGFDAWFACACDRDLNQRFGSARDAAAELKLVCDGASIAAGPYSSGSPASSRASSGPSSSVPTPVRSSGVPGQSVAGLSSSSLNRSATPPKRSRVGLGLGLLVVSLIVVGGAFLGYSHLKSEPAPAVSVSSVTSSVTQASAPAVVPVPEVSRSTEVTPASPVASLPGSPPSAAPVVSTDSASPRPAHLHVHAPHAATTEVVTPAAPPTPPPPPVKPVAKTPVNLGI